MSPRAWRLAGSLTTTKCQPWALPPVGACSASSRHSRMRPSSTGRAKSRRWRTERVVLRSSSGVSVSTIDDILVGDDRRDLAGLGREACEVFRARARGSGRVLLAREATLKRFSGAGRQALLGLCLFPSGQDFLNLSKRRLAQALQEGGVGCPLFFDLPFCDRLHSIGQVTCRVRA